jgi:hypothetical protein
MQFQHVCDFSTCASPVSESSIDEKDMNWGTCQLGIEEERILASFSRRLFEIAAVAGGRETGAFVVCSRDATVRRPHPGHPQRSSPRILALPDDYRDTMRCVCRSAQSCKNDGFSDTMKRSSKYRTIDSQAKGAELFFLIKSQVRGICP